VEPRVGQATKEVAMEHHSPTQSMLHSGSAYGAFAVQLLLSAVAMYLAMYLMIARIEDLHLNLNTLYMTAVMVAPMGVLMLLMMPSMYPRRGLNLALYAVFAVTFVAGIWFTRAQMFVGDEEFLRSMIPHHSGALLMCREADLEDAEIVALCRGIEASQSAEIAQMNGILQRL
jgi:hypothetical protein